MNILSSASWPGSFNYLQRCRVLIFNFIQNYMEYFLVSRSIRLLAQTLLRANHSRCTTTGPLQPELFHACMLKMLKEKAKKSPCRLIPWIKRNGNVDTTIARNFQVKAIIKYNDHSNAKMLYVPSSLNVNWTHLNLKRMQHSFQNWNLKLLNIN